jgi:hypothetical protein
MERKVGGWCFQLRDQVRGRQPERAPPQPASLHRQPSAADTKELRGEGGGDGIVHTNHLFLKTTLLFNCAPKLTEQETGRRRRRQLSRRAVPCGQGRFGCFFHHCGKRSGLGRLKRGWGGEGGGGYLTGRQVEGQGRQQLQATNSVASIAIHVRFSLLKPNAHVHAQSVTYFLCANRAQHTGGWPLRARGAR